ncbi:MAG: fibronectin type III domain-containing protein [Thermoanaerobaculia bacterium]
MRILRSLSLAVLLTFAAPGLASEPLPLAPPAVGLADYFDRVIVASDGEGYLALLSSYDLGAVYRIRLDPIGDPVDPAPAVLLPDVTLDPSAILLWRGDRYVLIWGFPDLHYAEISRDGALLALDSAWLPGFGNAHAAWNGDTLLVVAQEWRAFGRVTAAFRVGDRGAIESVRTIWNVRQFASTIGIAAAGQLFGVIVGGVRESRLLILTRDGDVVTSTAVPGVMGIAGVGSAFHLPVVRSAGRAIEHVVAGTDGMITRTEPIAEGSSFFGVLAIAGRDRVGIVFREASGDGSPAQQAFYVARENGEIVTIERPHSAAAVFADAWAVSATGDVIQILGHEMRVARSTIDAPLVEPAAFASAPALVRAPLRQSDLRITAGESVFLATWIEPAIGGRTLRAVRVSPSGAVLDDPPLEIDGARDRAVLYGGGEFLLAGIIFDPTINAAVLRVRRLHEDGTWGETDQIALEPGETGDGLTGAWNGSEFLLVWWRGFAGFNGNTPDDGIYGARVSASRISSVTRLTVAERADPDYAIHANPRVAWDGSQYLLTWSRRRFSAPCYPTGCHSVPSLAMRRLDRVTNPIGPEVDLPDLEVADPHVAAIAPGEFVVAYVEESLFGINAGGFYHLWPKGIETVGVRSDFSGIDVTRVHTTFNSPVSILTLDDGAGSATLVWSHDGPLDEVGKAQVGFGGSPWLAKRGRSPGADAAAAAPSGQTLLGRLAPSFPGGPPRTFAFFFEPATPLPFPPSAPTGVRAVRTRTAVEVTWDPVEGATGYRIEVASNDAFHEGGSSTMNSARIDGRFVDRVRVVALNSGGESAPSAAVEIEGPRRKRLAGR